MTDTAKLSDTISTLTVKNKIFQGDCLEVLKTLKDHSIDHIITDPPYGFTDNKWDKCIKYDDLWKEFNRILKPKGNVIIFCANVFTAVTMMSNKKMFKYKWIWRKKMPTNFLNAKKQPMRIYKEICVFYNGQGTYNPQMTTGKPYTNLQKKGRTGCNYGKTLNDFLLINEGTRYPIDILEFTHVASTSKEKVKHPTQKPLSLMRYLIRTYSNEGDTILDPFAGSGSTLVAAANEGRNYVGIEMDREYIDIIQKRLEV